jgi:hypothetical protein
VLAVASARIARSGARVQGNGERRSSHLYCPRFRR